MNRLQKAALLSQLIRKMREKGSWCGETHVQKAAFLLQEVMQVPMGFEFILYKHGPFSFDLRDELTALRADGLIGLEAQWPYGPRMVSMDASEYIRQLRSKTLADYDGRIAFVAESLGGKGVADLERLATAVFVTKRSAAGSGIGERAEELTRLKPHITLENAKTAIEETDRLLKEAKNDIN